MTKKCEICSSTKKVSASKADGGMVLCAVCKRDFGGPVRNSREGAVRR